MHDIRLLNSEDKCIIANKDKEEKKRCVGLGLWLRNRLTIYVINSIL